MKNIKSKENLPLKMTPFCVCVCSVIKRRGIFRFFSFVSRIREILCLYRPLWGTIEILVFNYDKIYTEGIGLDETYYSH